MSDQSAEEVVLRKYLLADLDEQQREQVEERLFCDDGFAEELFAAESRLVDDYVFDSLSQADREKFEQNFILNGERRKNLRFAQAFDAYFETENERRPEIAEPENRHPWWKNFLFWLNAHRAWTALAAAAVVVLVLVTPKAIKWLGPTNQIGSLQAQRAAAERQIVEINRRPFTIQSLSLPSRELTLQPAHLRGGPEGKRLEITSDIKLVNLRLTLPSRQYDNYTVQISTVEEGALFSVNDLPADDDNGVASILLRIPSEHLHTNDYQLQVKGINADGSIKDVALYYLPITSAVIHQNSP